MTPRRSSENVSGLGGRGKYHKNKDQRGYTDRRYTYAGLEKIERRPLGYQNKGYDLLKQLLPSKLIAPTQFGPIFSGYVPAFQCVL